MAAGGGGGWGAWLRGRCGAALAAAGPVPAHLAVIMDGNRRWARREGCAGSEGHRRGFATLVRVLEWCRDLGVRHVSVYAFSIENFRRSEAEVGELMALAEEKLGEILRAGGAAEARRQGLRVRVVGDLALLPEGVRRAAERAVAETRDNTGGTLNICLAYTGRDDIAQAVQARSEGKGGRGGSDTAREGGEAGRPGGREGEEGEVGGGDPLWGLLRTGDSPPVDLLVRTSGESRLSDFLPWQARSAQIIFLDVLWPELTFWEMAAAVARFQAGHSTMGRVRQLTRSACVRNASLKRAREGGPAEGGPAEGGPGEGGRGSRAGGGGAGRRRKRGRGGAAAAAAE